MPPRNHRAMRTSAMIIGVLQLTCVLASLASPSTPRASPPRGSRLFFEVHDDVWELRIGTRTPTRILQNVHDYDVASDGSRLVYSRRSGGARLIEVINLRSHTREQTWRGRAGFVQWSPNGKYFLCKEWIGITDRVRLWIYRLGERRRASARIRGRYLCGLWTPDNRLLVICNDGTHRGAYLLNRRGRIVLHLPEYHRVFDQPFLITSAYLSHDKRRLYFDALGRGWHGSLFVTSLRRNYHLGEPTAVEGIYSVGFDFSPTESAVVCYEGDGNFSIYSLKGPKEIRVTEEIHVTPEGHTDSPAIWSPDGAWIGFVRDGREICAVRADGTHLTTLWRLPERLSSRGRVYVDCWRRGSGRVIRK